MTWMSKTFADLCDLRTESINPSSCSDALYVGLEHIDPGSTTLKRWGQGRDVTSGKSKFYSNDVLFGKLRPYLDKAVLADVEGICSTDILVFQPKEATDPAFLSYFVHSKGFKDQAARTMRGVNHPRTSWASLREFATDCPEKEEQQAIARVLRTVQKAKETRQQELTLERERKAALMDYLFTHGTRNEPRKKREIGEFPESWETLPLKLCAQVQTGIAKGRKLEGVETIEVPYLRVANVQDGHLDLLEIKTITIKSSELQRYLLSPGDILMTEGGDFDKLGRGFIWNGEIEKCVHQNHVFAVRSNRDVLSPNYLCYLIQSPHAKQYFLSVAHKTTNLACINKSKLERFPVLIPSLQEQEEIGTLLQACDNKITALNSEFDLLQELFQALLEELMTGRLSVLPLLDNEAKQAKTLEVCAREACAR